MIGFSPSICVVVNYDRFAGCVHHSNGDGLIEAETNKLHTPTGVTHHRQILFKFIGDKNTHAGTHRPACQRIQLAHTRGDSVKSF